MGENFVVMVGRIFQCTTEEHAIRVAQELFPPTATGKRGIYRAVAMITWPESLESPETRFDFNGKGLYVVVEGEIRRRETLYEAKSDAVSETFKAAEGQKGFYVTRGKIPWPKPPWLRPGNIPTLNR